MHYKVPRRKIRGRKGQKAYFKIFPNLGKETFRYKKTQKVPNKFQLYEFKETHS